MSSKYASQVQPSPAEAASKIVRSALEESARQGRSLTQEALQRLRKDRMAMAGGVFLLLIAITSLLAPVLAPRDPIAVDLSQRLLSPGSPGYPLGTDQLGRDILSRLIWGGRISLLIGFSAVMLAMGLGVIIGLISGYFGGRLDSVVMRLIDVLMAFPAILLAITIVASLGPGLRNSMIAVSLVGIPFYVRIVRGSVLSLREQEFIHAARLIGASHRRILLRHVLPNTLAPLIVASTLDVGFFIMAAAGLSFLGLGAQPPTAEWGVMLSEGRQFIRNAPHLSIIPGTAIFLVVLALNFLGDGLRDALDPRLRG
jgi:peptide/nickel transport system permease protein